MLSRVITVLRQQALGALALFVALGGTSYAVATGSIDSREIKNSTVRSKDIRNGGVRFVQEQAAPVEGPPAGVPSNVAASCPSDHKAIGGGAAWVIPNFQDNNQFSALDAPITVSAPVPATAGTDDATGWQAFGRNKTGALRALRVYAVCVRK
jgi:hypothetical protein